MSTKIYDGIRFRARTLAGLVNDLTRAFAVIDQLTAKHEALFVAKTATRAYDIDWLGWKRDTAGLLGEPGPFARYVSRAWKELHTRQKEVRATRFRDPEVDSQVEIQVWQGPGRNLYGYVHTEVSGVLQHLLADGLATDFAYWNNSDRPEGMSAAGWRHRARVWKALLAGQYGKSFQFVGAEHPMPEAGLLMSLLPDIHSRARSLCEDEMYPKWLEENGISEVPVNRIGSTVMRFLRECKDVSGPWYARCEALARELQAELPDLRLADPPSNQNG